MSFLVSLNDEFGKSVLRTLVEKFIGLKMKKNENKHFELLAQISVRFVASLIVAHFYSFLPELPNSVKYFSYIFLFLFIYFFFVRK